MQRLHALRTSVETKSTVTDMVTEVDRESEALIVERLLAARPHDGILGEEGGERTGTSGVRWLVDPLDGTTNYLYRLPPFAVSVAADVSGRVVAGAVHDAGHDETFAAALGLGATRNGQPVAASSLGDLSRALVGTGFAYDPAVRARQGHTAAYLLPRVRDIRRSGAAAVDLCWLACGRLDGYYERGLHPWDYAAGALIVREAGGLAVIPPESTLVVAAGPRLFAPLRRLLDEAELEAWPHP